MKKRSRKSTARSAPNRFFEKAVGAAFVIWLVYRLFTAFPDWFDEIVAKALVFGLPAWLFLRGKKDAAGLGAEKFYPGLLIGLAVGGMFGFTGVLASVARGTQIQPFNLFLTAPFVNLLFVSFWTSWWESVFFFGFVQNAVSERLKKTGYAFLITTLLTAGVFLIFHMPILFMQSGVTINSVRLMMLLFVFALGQSLFYSRMKNMYALVLSYTFWGMVLAIYRF